MSSGTAKVVEYWEAILKRLQIYKAKACLREIHARMLREHLQLLEPPLEGHDKQEDDRSLRPSEDDSEHDKKDVGTFSLEPIIEETREAEEAGSFSPELLHGDKNDEEIDPEEDRAILERKRMAVREEQQRQNSRSHGIKAAASR